MRAALLAIFTALCACAQDAHIEGTTVQWGTGKPLANVHVGVYLAGNAQSADRAYGAVSDKQGHFAIAALPAGSYFYYGELPGFVSLRKGPGTLPVSTLILKPGETVQDLKIEMAGESVISGRLAG